VAFRLSDSVGTLIARFRSSIPSPPIPLFTLRWTPRGVPRKTRGRVDRYSFLVGIFHPLLPAGLSRRYQDIRFTSRWKTLYVIALGWPKETRQLVVKSLNSPLNGQDALLAKDEIARVSLLGSDAELHWQHESTGLKIQLPPKRPGDFAYVFKLLLN